MDVLNTPIDDFNFKEIHAPRPMVKDDANGPMPYEYAAGKDLKKASQECGTWSGYTIFLRKTPI